MFQKAMKNFEEKARQQQGQAGSTEHVKEGETVIDRRPRSQKESNKDVGEYVDYEEID